VLERIKREKQLMLNGCGRAPVFHTRQIGEGRTATKDNSTQKEKKKIIEGKGQNTQRKKQRGRIK